jgi:hypothetical protein
VSYRCSAWPARSRIGSRPRRCGTRGAWVERPRFTASGRIAPAHDGKRPVQRIEFQSFAGDRFDERTGAYLAAAAGRADRRFHRYLFSGFDRPDRAARRCASVRFDRNNGRGFAFR